MTVIIFLFVLSILVMVHELGHFFAARRAGIWVEEFGFGIPPRIWGKKIGETIYSINALPFGGFVRLHGENSREGLSKPKRAFMNKSKLARIIILTAGVFMNFVLAVFIFAITYSFTGVPRDLDFVKIVGISDNSPAAEAGLTEEDVVQQINGVEVLSVQQFQEAVADKIGEEVELIYVDDATGNTVEVNVEARENPPEGEGSLGVIISNTEIYFPPVWQRPFYGIYYGFKEAVFWGGQIIIGLGSLFSNLSRGNVPADLAGPVGIYAVTTQAASFGILALLNIMAVISVNLAILNILPFPALDGGRLMFVLLEGVVGKKVLPKVESYAHTIGMIILLILIFAITAFDIQRLIEAGGVQGFIDSIVESAQVK